MSCCKSNDKPEPCNGGCSCEMSDVLKEAALILTKREKERTVNEAVRVFSSYSGTDIKLYLSNEPELIFYKDHLEHEKWTKKYICLSEFSAFSLLRDFNVINERQNRGTIITALFTESCVPKLTAYKNAYFVAVNEFGNVSAMEWRGLRLVGTETGCAIDDLTMEERHTVSVREIKHWYKIR